MVRNWAPTSRAGSLSQQRREPLHPAVDGDMVDLDPALGEELFDVAVRQAEAQVPADREHDHLGWEAEAGKGGPRDWREARAVGSHAASLAAATPAQPTQQSHLKVFSDTSGLDQGCYQAGCHP
jgi:hypothetical protein